MYYFYLDKNLTVIDTSVINGNLYPFISISAFSGTPVIIPTAFDNTVRSLSATFQGVPSSHVCDKDSINACLPLYKSPIVNLINGGITADVV